MQKTKTEFKVNKLNFAMIGMLLFAPVLSMADTAWAKTPFWQAPVIGELKVGIADGTSELKASCDALRTFVDRSSSLPAKYLSKNFDYNRKTALQSQLPNAQFKMVFKTDLDQPANVLKPDVMTGLNSVADAQAAGDEAFLFTQHVKAQVLDPSQLDDFELVKSDDSFAALAAHLGLDASPVKLQVLPDGVSLVVDGKDLACDFAAGKVQLKVKGKSRARIDLDPRVKLGAYYQDVAAISNSVVKKYPTAGARAAALGFRIGTLLTTSQKVSADKAEATMISTIDRFFDAKSMTQNALWSVQGGEKVLAVDQMSDEIPLTLTVGRPQ